MLGLVAVCEVGLEVLAVLEVGLELLVLEEALLLGLEDVID